MKMPPKPRRTHGKSLRAICKKLRLPFRKTKAPKDENARP